MGVEELPNSDEIPLTQVYSLLCKYTEAKRNGDEKFQSFESDIKGHGMSRISCVTTTFINIALRYYCRL
jgi:hypothetical protein